MKSRKQYLKEYYQKRYNERKIVGLCTSCGKYPPFKTGNTRCEKCRDKMKKRCTSKEFKEKERVRSRKRYKENPEAYKLSCRKYINNLRDQAFEIYGKECACCGESIREFLTIDHILGGGNEHRKSLGYQSKYLQTIIKEKDKSKYQTLCMNCNWGKRFSGICPHKLKLK